MMTLLGWIVLAIVAGAIASEKNRSPIGWAILGFLFGIFAVVCVIVLPEKELIRHTPSTSPSWQASPSDFQV